MYAVTDEVYEHLVFTDAPSSHLPLGQPAQNAGANAANLVGRQDILLHRLEDRLG